MKVDQKQVCELLVDELKKELRDARINPVEGVWEPLPGRDKYLKKLERMKFKTISDIMRFCRSEMCWDLWRMLTFLARFLEIDKDIENGSCQNTHHRQVAQLVKFYDVDVEAFYRWDT